MIDYKKYKLGIHKFDGKTYFVVKVNKHSLTVREIKITKLSKTNSRIVFLSGILKLTLKDK